VSSTKSALRDAAEEISGARPAKNNGQGMQLSEEPQEKSASGLQKLKSRHDSIKSRHDSIKSRHDSMESRRDFTFILPLRSFFRGGEKPLFRG
jgi:hypothetical protein